MAQDNDPDFRAMLAEQHQSGASPAAIITSQLDLATSPLRRGLKAGDAAALAAAHHVPQGGQYIVVFVIDNPVSSICINAALAVAK